MKTDDAIPTRHSLLRRLKDWDDQGSWEEFFEIYWRLIHGVALQAGLTEEEAQDVVQETVMTVAKNIKNFKADPAFGSFRNWLLHITRWRIADQFRKRLPPAGHLEHHGDEAPDTSTAERLADPASLDLDAVWEHEWEQNLVDAALDRIKPQVNPAHYQMFDLHVLKQWPARKVAHRLGVTTGKVYLAKYKISRLLKKEVRRLETRFT